MINGWAFLAEALSNEREQCLNAVTNELHELRAKTSGESEALQDRIRGLQNSVQESSQKAQALLQQLELVKGERDNALENLRCFKESAAKDQ
eukprot:scaffold110329_cov19-Prasinocladus_malaysianus.AAC.1